MKVGSGYGACARREAQLGTSIRGHEDTSTPLHEERLDVVTKRLLASGASSVLDLGCGTGALLARLVVEAQFTRIVGLDVSLESILLAERLRATSVGGEDERLSFRHGSFTAADDGLTGFEAAAMIETIEHVPPAHLSRVERAVFAEMRPSVLVMTTPNREYNPLYGLVEGELRHSDHRFEWNRSRFEAWAKGVAGRNGYAVEFEPIGPSDAWLGSPTQMGVFRRGKG